MHAKTETIRLHWRTLPNLPRSTNMELKRYGMVLCDGVPACRIVRANRCAQLTDHARSTASSWRSSLSGDHAAGAHPTTRVARQHGRAPVHHVTKPAAHARLCECAAARCSHHAWRHGLLDSEPTTSGQSDRRVLGPVVGFV